MSVPPKSKDNKSEPVAYSEAALRNNAIVVEYCRTSMAALSGSTAGRCTRSNRAEWLCFLCAVCHHLVGYVYDKSWS
ncbi:unnamed protein product [Diatraea saccharalis]|uniref:Uncharacterized protein n=1 Tax=Diatraea saccharalis TaxID=40085 RepID=A0A9N9RE57_9NEOP|nr:unnamed protein product [Diatraea saccharalis]